MYLIYYRDSVESGPVLSSAEYSIYPNPSASALFASQRLGLGAEPAFSLLIIAAGVGTVNNAPLQRTVI